MITSIEIENLRGIRAGRLDGLAPLTILTGPNGCGKSTVLDALLIGASREPTFAVRQAVDRHPAVAAGARWLCFGDERKAKIVVGCEPDGGWTRDLQWSEHCKELLRQNLVESGSPPPYSEISGREDPSLADASWEVAFGGDNQGKGYSSGSGSLSGRSNAPVTRLVDPGLPIPLHRTFTEVSKAGRRDAVHELLSTLVPGFERLEILALTDTELGLHVVADGRAVPVGLAGDGIQAFVQLALEIAVAPDGLVLVEEPEVY